MGQRHVVAMLIFIPDAARPRGARARSGQITLRKAERLIAGDWLKAYRARFG
jgi:hypothetical protein